MGLSIQYLPQVEDDVLTCSPLRMGTHRPYRRVAFTHQPCSSSTPLRVSWRCRNELQKPHLCLEEQVSGLLQTPRIKGVKFVDYEMVRKLQVTPWPPSE